MKTFIKVLALFLILFTLLSCQKQHRKIQNIETFAILYGYARWFHPSDEGQQIDWNKFAVLGIQKVEYIKSEETLRDTLYSLFSPIIQGLQLSNEKYKHPISLESLVPPDTSDIEFIGWQHLGVGLGENDNRYKSIRVSVAPPIKSYSKESTKSKNAIGLFERFPEFGELIIDSIGRNLYCIVPLSLHKQNGETYPQSYDKHLKELQFKISEIKLTSAFDMHTNLASVIISWNVFQHFYPYFDVVTVDWKKVLSETIEKTYTNKNNIDFTKTLSEMVAKLEDGHGLVLGKEMYHLPIRTEFIENNIIVTASNDPKVKIGDIIIKIDGINAKKLLEDSEKYISGSPQLKRFIALNIFGSAYENKFTKMTIDRNGSKFRCELENKIKIKDIFLNPINNLYCTYDWIREIEPSIFYVNMRNCTYEYFLKKIHELANAKIVIYDCRWGHNCHLFHILPHLSKVSVNSAWMMRPQIIYPNGQNNTFNKTNFIIEPEKPYFKSKSIVILSPIVASSDETAMGIIDHYNLATTVGETTAGCNGNINFINLPNGLKIRWTGMKVLKHDGSQHHLVGFKPQYPVFRTLIGVKNRKDEVLEKAIKVAKSINAP